MEPFLKRLLIPFQSPKMCGLGGFAMLNCPLVSGGLARVNAWGQGLGGIVVGADSMDQMASFRTVGLPDYTILGVNSIIIF